MTGDQALARSYIEYLGVPGGGALRRRFREANCHRASGEVRDDVYQRRLAVLDRFLRALQRRADVFRLFDLLAVAAQALREEVEARVAQVAPGLLLLGIGRPAAVQADDDDDRKVVARGGVELHAVETERAVAMQHHHLLVGLRGLGADAERHADAHGAEGPGIEAVARVEG